MLQNIFHKRNLPHLISILVLAAISVAYCMPVLKGERIVQTDIVNYRAQSHETREYREVNDAEALWTTRVFSGMSTFNISTVYPANIFQYVERGLRGWLPKESGYIFILGIGMYILLISLGLNPWLALIFAGGYSVSSNLLVSLVAGHNTKVLSIGYMAPALAGTFLAYRGRQFLGGALLTVSLGLLFQASHYQIVYYFLLSAGIVAITHFIFALLHKELPKFARATGILILAGALGVLPNFAKVYNIYEHGTLTIRGGNSELAQKKEEDKGGLDRGYAFSWSYGIGESLTTIVPSYSGGASGEGLSENGEVAEALKSFNVSGKQKQQILKGAPLYIGDQPFVQGTVYFGAAFIFLFILSLLIVRNELRIWIVSLVILSFVIAWGRNFSLLANFLFDYLPAYNKFRTPSMALAIGGLAVPVLGALGLNQILNGSMDKVEFMKKFKIALYITGGTMALLLLGGLMGDWTGPNDAKYMVENSPWAIPELYDALQADRKSNFISDWTLSTLIMAICAALIWIYNKGTVKAPLLLGAFALLIIGDHWRVSKRYLNDDSFTSKRGYEAKFNTTPADKAILADNDPHFRVLNITRNPWVDAETCYHHKNIGGHHAAKLQRYQDLISRQLTPQLQMVQSGLMQRGDQIVLNPAIGQQLSALNMLNAKYLIVQENMAGGAVINSSACGSGWFVSNIKKVATADEEMNAISSINPKTTAIVHEEFSDALYGYSFGKSDNASLQLTEVKPNLLKYKSSNDQDGLAVFSEIYYPKGWVATIDGEPAEIHRVNYLLRAIKVPAGEREIVMSFEPASYSTGMAVSYAGSALLILFIGGMLFFASKRKNEGADTEANEAD